MEKKKGGFPRPGEAGYEALTLKMAEKWGADVIRDSDGTELSEEIICHVIVHGNFFPHAVCQKAYRIIMKRNGLLDYHVAGFLFKAPLSVRCPFI